MEPAGNSFSSSSPFCLGDWLVEPKLNTVSRHGQTVHVRRQLIDLLVFLANHPGQAVSKEEIFKAVWPGQYVAESGLARCISQLRDVFQDDFRDPHVIETIPARGYSLLLRAEPAAPPVTDSPPQSQENEEALSSLATEQQASDPQQQPVPGVPVSAAGSRLGRPLLAAAAVLLVAAATVGVLKWRASGIPSFGDRDTLLVSFDNQSGEPVFDDSLRLALTIQLEQSPYLRVVAEQRIREELAFMKRSAGEQVTHSLAMDLRAPRGSRRRHGHAHSPGRIPDWDRRNGMPVGPRPGAATGGGGTSRRGRFGSRQHRLRDQDEAR